MADVRARLIISMGSKILHFYRMCIDAELHAIEEVNLYGRASFP